MALTKVQSEMSNATAPAFSAQITSNQSISATTNTQLQFATEVVDTASCYNNTGSTVGGIPAYSFLPTVAGYYQINLSVNNGGNATGSTFWIVSVRKNGTIVTGNTGTNNSFGGGGAISAIIYLNGTSDYIDGIVSTGYATTAASGANSYFSASLVRPA